MNRCQALLTIPKPLPPFPSFPQRKKTRTQFHVGAENEPKIFGSAPCFGRRIRAGWPEHFYLGLTRVGRTGARPGARFVASNLRSIPRGPMVVVSLAAAGPLSQSRRQSLRMAEVSGERKPKRLCLRSRRPWPPLITENVCGSVSNRESVHDHSPVMRHPLPSQALDWLRWFAVCFWAAQIHPSIPRRLGQV